MFVDRKGKEEKGGMRLVLKKVIEMKALLDIHLSHQNIFHMACPLMHSAVLLIVSCTVNR